MPVVPNTMDVFNFLQNPERRTGVLAYLDTYGRPDTATVAFSATGHLGIIFGTSDTSRKFRLLHADHRVGFNVTDIEQRLTVQLKGFVRELSSNEVNVLEAAHYVKLGESSRRFRGQTDQHFFLIEPFWLRFTDCLEEPWTPTVLIDVAPDKKKEHHVSSKHRS